MVNSLILFLFFFLIPAGKSDAAISRRFNYQGKLTNNSDIAVSDNAYDMVFNIYANGGGTASALWTESWKAADLWTETSTVEITDGNNEDCPEGSKKIAYVTTDKEGTLAAGQDLWNLTLKESALIYAVNTSADYLCIWNPLSPWSADDDLTNQAYVKNGIFSVTLGTVTPINIDINGDYYLGVTIGNDSEMVPRKKISPAPLALNSMNLTGDGYIDIDATNSAQDAVNINFNPTMGAMSAVDIIYGSGGGTGTALVITQNGNGDLLDLLDGTNEFLTVKHGGNMGIGTSAPDNLLTLANDYTGLDPILDFKSFGVTTFSMGIDVSDSNKFKIENANSLGGANPALVINSIGDIGIGTSSPDNELTLNEGVGMGNVIIDFQVAGVTKFSTGVDASDSNKFKIETSNILGGTNPAFVINSLGQVGIGTASPATLFHVAGGNITLDNLNTTTAASLIFKEGTNYGTGYVALKAPDNIGGGTFTFTLPASNGSNNQILQTNGSGILSWSDNSTTGLSNVLQATGDIIYSIGSAPQRLGIGITVGSCLTVGAGGVPAWGSCSGSAAGGANTQVIYNSTGSYTGSANFTWDNTAQTLSLVGGTASPKVSLILRNSTAGAAANEHLYIGNDSSPNIFDLIVNSTNYTGAGNNVSLYNQANAAMIFGTSGIERMRITNAGLVGLGFGITSPIATLQIGDTATTASSLLVSNATLSSGNLVSFSTTSTAATGNTQTGLNIGIGGTNVNTTQTTYGIQVLNNHGGTLATNIAGKFLAVGGTANTGIQIGAMSGNPATNYGLDIGAMSGSSANYGINIGAFTVALANYGINISTFAGGGTADAIKIGGISSTGATAYYLNLGAISGANPTAHAAINIGNIGGATTTASGIVIGTIGGASGGSSTDQGIAIGAITTTNATAGYGYYLAAMTGSGTTNAGMYVTAMTTTGTNNYNVYAGGLTGNTGTNYGVYVGSITNSVTKYSFYGAGLTGILASTNTGLYLGNISGSSGNSINTQINTGTITGVGTTNSQLNLGAVTGGTAGNYGINIGAVTGITGALNYGINIGAMAGSGAVTLYGINVAAIAPTAGAGPTTYGMKINSGAAAVTSNYGLNITQPSGATHNSALVIGAVATGSGTWGIYSSTASNSYFAGNVGIGTTNPLTLLHILGGHISLGTLNATTSAEMRFYEASNNGTEFVSLKAPLSVGSTVNFILPDTYGSVGQVLQTSGATGILSWTANSATGMANPMTNTGDIIYALNTANPSTPQRLGIGLTVGSCLTVGAGGVPAWGSCSGNAAGGGNTQVIYNSTGSYTGSAEFTWDNTNKTLSIGSSANAAVNTLALRNTNTGSSANNHLYIGNNTSASALDLWSNSSAFTANGNVANIYNQTNAALAFGTNALERMRIDNAGNVGIGTTAPTALLDVNGAVAHGLGLVATPSITFRGDLNTGIWSSAADTINFSTAGLERLRITSTGLIGIGITSPTAILHIVDTAVTTGNSILLTTNTLTTGSLVSFSSTSTAANSNTQTVLNVATSGANANATQTTFGLNVANTHAGTASTNIAGKFTATSGITNYGLQVAAMTGATSYGMDIGNMSGITLNTAINIGTITGNTSNTAVYVGTITGNATNRGVYINAITAAGVSTNTGFYVGNISGSVGASTNTGVSVGNISGTATNAYGMNIGTITGGTTANYGVTIGAMSGPTSYGLNIGALSGITLNSGVQIAAISGNTTNRGVYVTSITASGVSTNTGFYVGNISGSVGASTNTGVSVGNISGTATNAYGMNIGTITGATNSGANYGVNIGAITTTQAGNSYGINIGAMTGAGGNAAAVNISALTTTGTTNYGINVGGLTGAGGTNYGMYIGTITNATNAKYSIYTNGITGNSFGTNASVYLGAIASSTTNTTSNTQIATLGVGGTALNNYQLNLGTVTSGTTGNYGINIGAVTSVASANNYGINIAAMAGTGIANYGLNVTAPTSTGFATYGAKIGGPTGAATANYGLSITVPTSATLNAALFLGVGATGTGTWAVYSSLANNSYFASNIGIGTSSPAALLHLVGGSFYLGALTTNTTAEMRFYEGTSSGTEFVSLKAPISIGSTVNFILPDAYGVAGQVLQTSGATGVLSWSNNSATGMANPMTNTGDLIYSSSGSAPQRLGIGLTVGSCLTVGPSNNPVWGPCNGGSSLAAGGANQIQYNVSGSFSASAQFTYDNSLTKLGVGSSANSAITTLALINTSAGSSANNHLYIGNNSSASALDLWSNSSNFTANGNVANIYNQTNAPLAFGTNTAERMRIDAAGNLGIGITSPLALLDVNGIGAFGAGAVTTPSIALRADLNTGLWSVSSDILNISTGGTERMRIDASGNLGIGTTTNSGRIYIFDNAVTTASALYLQSTSLTSGNLAYFYTNSTSAASNTQTGVKSEITGANASQTTYALSAINTHSGATSVNYAGYFTATGATTNYGVAVAAMTGATSYGLNIGNMSGATLDTAINIGTISGGATNTSIATGAISGASTNAYGINLGTITGATGNNIGVNLAAITAIAGSTNYGINIAAIAATAIASTANYGIKIAGPAATGGAANYGLNITDVAGATHNANLVLGTVATVTGSWNIYSASANNSYFAGNIGIGISAPTSRLHISATAAPTTDMVTISNVGYGITTDGISALQVNYVGGAGAIEASSARFDITPGGTTASTWNALRIVGSAAASGVTENGIKFENLTAGAGSERAISIGTGWKFPLYVGSTSPSYFAGSIGIGTTAPIGNMYIAATTAPVSDMVTISNLGYGTNTTGVSALQVTYVGGTTNIEASSQRVDITPGSASGSTWNALRIVGSTTASGVNMNGIKFDNLTAGTGTETALLIGTGWDYGIFSTTTNTSYFAGKIGIGTTAPTAMLSVTGGIRVGLTYAGIGSTVATNDSWFEGNIGVGYTAPTNKIQLDSDTYATNTGWTDGSDRNTKENFQILSNISLKPITLGSWTGNGSTINAIEYTDGPNVNLDGSEIISRLSMLPIMRWNFIADDEQNKMNNNKINHIGPTAQDFYKIFGLGASDKTIRATDLAGVALGGLKALIERTDNQQALIQNQGIINNQQELKLTDIDLKTNQNITTVAELQKSIDEQLSKIANRLAGEDKNFTDQDKRIASLENLSKDIQDQVDELKKLTNQDLNVAQIEANTTDLDYIKTLLGIDGTGNVGDVTLLGKLEADGIVAGVMTVKVVDKEKRTVGEGEITPVKNDKDNDGIDDDTDSDGKSLIIKTKAIDSNSKIFTSIESDKASKYPLTITDRKNGESFKVEFPEPVSEKVKFSWWIMEKDDSQVSND